MLLILVIGASRIYNGVHTYNQVIQGYVWGIVTYLTFCHICYDYICRFLENTKRKTVSELIFNPLITLFFTA